MVAGWLTAPRISTLRAHKENMRHDSQVELGNNHRNNFEITQSFREWKVISASILSVQWMSLFALALTNLSLEDLIQNSPNELIKSDAHEKRMYKITKISFLCGAKEKHEEFIADAKLKFIMLWLFPRAARGEKTFSASQFGGIPRRSIYSSTFCELEFAAGF